MRKTANSSARWEHAGMLLGNMHLYHHVNSKYEAKPEDAVIKESQRAVLRDFAMRVGPVEAQTLVVLDGAGLPEVTSHIHNGMNFKKIQVIERDKATYEGQVKDAAHWQNVEIIRNDLIMCVQKPFKVDCFSLDFMGSFGMLAKQTGKRICDTLELIIKNNQTFRWCFRINVMLDTRVNGETYEEVSQQIEKMIADNELKIIEKTYDDQYGKMCNRTYLVECIPIDVMEF
jgi:hypothetical protein